MMLGIANGIKPFRGRPRFRMRRFLLLGTASSLVAACGFQLAGSARLPAAMQTTYLDSSEPRSEFYSSLSEALRQRGLMLVDSSGEAGARLIISEDSAGQRVLSVTARNIPREYEVFYSVTFALEAEGEPLIQPEVLVARECKSRVHDDDLVPELVHRHVLADLAEAAERDDAQRCAHAPESTDV